MKNINRLGLTASAAAIAFGIVFASSPAFAQDKPADATAAADEGATIIVTGSRIARVDLQATSPIAIVSAESIKLQGQTNIENVLNNLPQVMGDVTGASNNPGGGIATVNLRGLGAQRTLVLVDGRRYLSYDTSQIVDLNTVPTALIERVDVVTGGKSAVYGSDAIAGVVNFVLKQDFSGIELNAKEGITSRGDGATTDVNATIGANFDDHRGNATLNIGYYKRKSIFAGQRSFGQNALSDNEDGTPFFNGGSGSVDQGRINVGGGFRSFNSDGTTKAYSSATDAYNYAPINYLQVPQKRFLMSAQAHYEVSDAFQPYLQGQFINNRVLNQLAATPINQGTPQGTGAAAHGLGSINVLVNSPFFAPSTQAYLRGFDTDGDGVVAVPGYGFRTTGIGPRIESEDRNAYRIVAGMKGDIGKGWSYDGYYMYARTTNQQRQAGNVSLSAFLSSTNNAFQATNGTISNFPSAGATLVCADAAARASGCVPANLYGRGNLSAAAANYLSIAATNLESYTTQVASFAVTNADLYDLGAGGIGVAIGAEWRKEAGAVNPDTNLASGNVAGFNPGAPTSGSYTVREFFGEIDVPLLADQAFAKKLDLNGAVRESHYNVAGGAKFNAFTWTGGAIWQPIADITFRGQYSRAIRGPSVNELFLGQTVSFDGANDPCGSTLAVKGSANFSQTVFNQCTSNTAYGNVPQALLGSGTLTNSDDVNPPTFISGNKNLKEEKAKTWTVGGVLQPSFLRGFNFTADYYDIKITGYISRLGQNNLFNACYQYGLSQYCQFTRVPGLSTINTIADTTLNSGGLKTRGLDFSADYSRRLDFGLFGAHDSKIAVSANVTHLLKYDFTPIIGVPLVNKCAGKFGAICGVPNPKWKSAVRTTFATGLVSASLQWRYEGKVGDDDPTTTYYSETLKAQNYFDLAVSVDATENINFTAGVNNMLDKSPPLAASTQNGGNGEQTNTYPEVYDVIGRQFFVSATLKF
jgi:outer membrane receptor protein involved in Fe transport